MLRARHTPRGEVFTIRVKTMTGKTIEIKDCSSNDNIDWLKQKIQDKVQAAYLQLLACLITLFANRKAFRQTRSG